MSEYTYEHQICSKCKKLNYCILSPEYDDTIFWLCQDCFLWSIGYADKKDKINELFSRIPDIEK